MKTVIPKGSEDFTFYSFALISLFVIKVISFIPRSHISTIFISDWEAQLPFVIELIWPYLLSVWILQDLFFRIKKVHLFNEFFFWLVILLFIHLIIYIVVPISYPYEFYPVDQFKSVSERFLYQIRVLLPSMYSFPSYYFSILFLSSLLIKSWTHILLVCILAITSILLKMNFIMDIVGSFILVAVIQLIRTLVFVKD